MTSIAPKPRQFYLRDDGDGGLDLCVVAEASGLHVQPLSPAAAAQWIERLAEYLGRKMKERMPS